MKEMIEEKRKVAEVFPPSVFIKEEMDERGWSIETVCEKGLMQRALLESVLANRRRITPITAMCLALAFETSPEIWMNLQRSFDNQCGL